VITQYSQVRMQTAAFSDLKRANDADLGILPPKRSPIAEDPERSPDVIQMILEAIKGVEVQRERVRVVRTG